MMVVVSWYDNLGEKVKWSERVSFKQTGISGNVNNNDDDDNDKYDVNVNDDDDESLMMIQI